MPQWRLKILCAAPKTRCSQINTKTTEQISRQSCALLPGRGGVGGPWPWVLSGLCQLYYYNRKDGQGQFLIILDFFPLYTLACRTNAFASGGSEELTVFCSEVTYLHKQFQQLLGPVSLTLTHLLNLIRHHVSVPRHRSMLWALCMCAKSL